jgi:PKD repeat protein
MRRTLLAVVLVFLLAGAASAAVPAMQAVSTDTASWWQGQKTWLTWTNTSDGTTANRTTSMGINWGDGTKDLFASPIDTVRSHVYEAPGTYTVQFEAVNVAGTGYGTCTVTVLSGRTRYITTAGTKIHLSHSLRAGMNQVTISSTGSCRIKGWRSGTADVISWPIAAGVPWTIPAYFDSLTASSLADTVWVHVW